MKNLKLIVPALLLLFSACSQATRTSGNDLSEGVQKDALNVADSLETKISVNGKVIQGEPLVMRFVVYNNTDSTKSFCIWHTPFEPLMSKYLDITNEKGEEVAYKGAMAKRMMPPPADSYTNVKPGDSLVANADLLKGYDLKTGSSYKLTYNGSNMSGLVSKDTVTFVYEDIH
ncbi:protease [Pedobacter yonginense]|uniref:Protease n=1 Tax=Pedobacter yonginense TaxID=651869 RepID=A0A317ES65_9SPHI|nr:protease [Pedobacter yonginense]PWS29544.1 protease [Pedobacter yonginense]